MVDILIELCWIFFSLNYIILDCLFLCMSQKKNDFLNVVSLIQMVCLNF